MADTKYSENIFINCPFDEQYKGIFYATIFTILDCGFFPKSSLEFDDGTENRLEKIIRIIGECKFGIHDISRTELDSDSNLPRFNMPFELGLFIGARKFGGRLHKEKFCLIMDKTKYRYQSFISDISGQDIQSHNDDPRKVISIIRSWITTTSRRKTIPGGNSIWKRYNEFENDLPAMCKLAKITEDELTYIDRINFISEWLRLIAL